MMQSSLDTLAPALLVLVAFVLGSIPFRRLMARAFKAKDSRELPLWPAGTIRLALDFMKGALAVFLALPMGVQLWSSALGISIDAPAEAWAWACGLAVVLGHCFSPWTQFQGGKGIAVSFGVVVLLSPLAAGLGLAAFVLTYLARQSESLAAIAALVFGSLVHLVLEPLGSHLWTGAALVLVILLRHEKDIDALLEARGNRA